MLISYFQPDTTPVLPAPGSAWAFPYPSPNSLITSASSDSFGDRSQEHAVSSTLSPPPYTVAYPRTQSLSDLANYNRVDSLQKESQYANGLIEDVYNTPYGLQSQSYLPTTSASDSMTHYYGALGSPRAWNHNAAEATAMAADLARSQSAIFYGMQPLLCSSSLNLLFFDFGMHSL